jgi:hypothetical protein
MKTKQGIAWAGHAALRFQIPSQASLQRDYETTSPTRFASDPVFSRFARDYESAKNWHPEKARGTPGLPGWRGF